MVHLPAVVLITGLNVQYRDMYHVVIVFVDLDVVFFNQAADSGGIQVFV